MTAPAPAMNLRRSKGITPLNPPNVQASIRRAPRMADKTSWTKPRARMTYGDSIVEAGGLTAGIGAAAGPWPGRLRAHERVTPAGWAGAPCSDGLGVGREEAARTKSGVSAVSKARPRHLRAGG